MRFVEVVVNGPKTWSLAAALHPEIAAAYDAAQDRAAAEIIGWLAEHATTRVGPRGRQVQVPVEQLEAAVVRHYTSRAGDPHRHLHLQINARVFAAGGWRGLHSVGVVDSIEAINGIGHAAVMCDPEFRHALAAHGYTLDPDTGEVAAARAVRRGVQRPGRADQPQHRPLRGRVARRAPRRGARARRCGGPGTGGRGRRPDPTRSSPRRRRAGRALGRGAARARASPPPMPGPPSAVARWRRRSGGSTGTRSPTWRSPGSGPAGRRWNAADIRGEVERIIAAVDVVAAGAGAPRAGRGPDRPHRRRRACRCWPATTCPSTSAP